MRTRSRSVSFRSGVVPLVAAAALLPFGVGCGAPRGAPASAPEGPGLPPPALEEARPLTVSPPEDAVSIAAVRLRWSHDASLGRVIVRVDEVRGDGVFPFSLPVRMHHVDGSLEDALLPMTGQGRVCEVRCEEEPVAVSFDPDGVLDGVITIEAGS